MRWGHVFTALALACLIAPATFGRASANEHNLAPTTWAGFYAGVQAGYQWNAADFRDPVPPYSGTYDADGIVVGGLAGYNFQRGMVVFGIQGEFEYADGSGDGITQSFDVMGRGEINWQGAVLARVGIAADKTLVYVLGGVTFADFDFNYTCCAAGWIDPLSDTLAGWTLGAGFELDLGDNWSTRLEGRYTNFEQARGSIANCCALLPYRQEHDVEARSFRAALVRRF